MNVLLYDNASMVIKSGRYYCASGTGKFAKELVELGHDVVMFGQQVENQASISCFDIVQNGIKVAGVKRHKNKIVNYLISYIASVKYISKADFIYFFYPSSFRYLAIICILLKKKYGLYVRGDENIDDAVSHFLYKKAYVVFTVAQFFTDIVNKVNKNQVGHTIRPMIPYTDNDVELSRTYQNKRFYSLLFLCRIQKEKGVEELLNAVKLLREDGIDNFKLEIVGDGPYLDRTKELVDILDIKDAVSVEGAINDVNRLKHFYSEADIYVLPTYYREGFPRTLYEAMIFGTPVITTFVAGISSLMVDKYNCVRIEPRSADSIKEAIKSALESYETMGDYARNATNTVLAVVDHNRLSHAQDVDKAIRNNI